MKKKTDPSGHQLNFVMKDAAEPEAAENQPDMPEDPAKAAAPPGHQQRFRTESGFWRIK